MQPAKPENREPTRQHTLEAATAEYKAHTHTGMSRARRKAVAKQVGLLRYPGAFAAANDGLREIMDAKTKGSDHAHPST